MSASNCACSEAVEKAGCDSAGASSEVVDTMAAAAAPLPPPPESAGGCRGVGGAEGGAGEAAA